jgi:hypothetical protein
MTPALFLAQIATATNAATAAAGDIRDIRGPIAIPTSWAWIRWVVAALVLLALAWAGWRAWRRHRDRKPAPDPLAIALAELEKTRALLHPETAREFSIAVSDVVRMYIEARFAARAAHRTTEEFLHDLAGAAASPLAPYREVLTEFLRHCDLAKFGRWALTVGEMEAMLASARVFLLDTQPRPVPPSVPAK